MVAYNEDRRSAASRDFLRFLSSHEWGTLILDEVHVVPAEMFRKVCNFRFLDSAHPARLCASSLLSIMNLSSHV